MTEWGGSRAAVLPTVPKSCCQRSLPCQTPPGSVLFLPEGMLVAKVPQGGLSHPRGPPRARK